MVLIRSSMYNSYLGSKLDSRSWGAECPRTWSPTATRWSFPLYACPSGRWYCDHWVL